MTDPKDSERRELFEQVMSALSVSGQPVSDTVREAFEPLLNGEMSYEEHRDYLRKLYNHPPA